MHRPVACFGAVLLVSAAPLAGQEVSLFAGGTHARYADSLSGSAAVTAARLRSHGSHSAGELQVGASQFSSGEWAVQAAGQIASFTPIGGRGAVGLTAGVTAGNFEGGSWSGMAATGPLVAVSVGRALLTAGVSAGGARSVDQVNRAMGTGSLLLRYRTADGVRLDLGAVGTTATDAIRYLDLSGGILWEPGPVSLAASAGVRTGELSDGPWGQARLEIGPRSTARFEAAAGWYPRDLSGFSDGFFVQVGFRLAFGAAAPRERAATPAVRATPLDDGRVRVTVRYDRPVHRLEIAGAFSDWQPVPLTRAGDGTWTAELTMPAGVHHFALIADGEWTLPEGIEPIDDGFGGQVGILIVQR